MTESFVLPRKSIIESFISVSFLPEQVVTENDIFNISQNILLSFGIKFQDFPYAICEFFIKNWYSDISKPEKLPDLVNEMLEIIEAAMSSKKIICDYLSILKQTLYDFSREIITNTKVYSILVDHSSSVLVNNSYFCQDKEKIFDRHHRVIFEDSFAILFAFTCLFDVSENLRKLGIEDSYDVDKLINYISKLLHGVLDELFKMNNPDHIKVLIRGWAFKDFYHIESINGFMSECIIDTPPLLMPKDHFGLFIEIINSSVLRQVIEIYIKDTLTKEDPPFNNEEDGIKMIFEGLNWISNIGNVYYADLIDFAHGFSNDEYIFVNFSFNRRNDFS